MSLKSICLDRLSLYGLRELRTLHISGGSPSLRRRKY